MIQWCPHTTIINYSPAQFSKQNTIIDMRTSVDHKSSHITCCSTNKYTTVRYSVAGHRIITTIIDQFNNVPGQVRSRTSLPRACNE